MRLLLDTHTFFWFVFDDPQLSATARQLLESRSNELFLSIASVWEASIEAGTGRLTLKPDVLGFFENEARDSDIQFLAIELRHLAPISSLPLHHRDPFDRLLIAQSLVEGVPLVSADAEFDAYAGISRLW